MSRNVSTAARRALYASQTGEAFLILLEISHADLATPIRITSDMINTPHGQDFLATFTRASTATKLDGSSVGVNVPRYEAGQYGQAIMIEESAGARADEILTIPATKVHVDAGTIEIDVLVDGEIHTAAAGRMIACVIRNSNDTNQIRIEKNNLTTQWRVVFWSDTASWLPVFPVAAGWRRMAVSWDVTTGAARVFVDGVVVAENLTAPLPVSFDSVVSSSFFIGRNSSDFNYFNSLIGGLRISSRARTSAEMLAGMGRELRIDEDTTAFLSFNSTLQSNHLYVATPFQVTLPDDRDDQISRATLTVDNVDRRIVEAIRSITGAPTVTMSIVMGSNPQQVEAGPFEFRLSGVGYDSLTVEGSLGYEEDFLNTAFPADDFTPQNTPGLFA